MIDEETLRLWRLSGVGSPVIDSHIEAWQEIKRLQNALKDVMVALDAVDSGDFDKTVEAVMRLDLA